jgi:predicted GNAT family acetyltransferase
MQINLDEVEVVNNQAKRRFEVVAAGYLARIEYIPDRHHIVYTHTIVPDEISGQGVGSKLAHHVLDYARDNDLKVIPQCPFVAAYIERHPEYKPLVWDPHASGAPS